MVLCAGTRTVAEEISRSEFRSPEDGDHDDETAPRAFFSRGIFTGRMQLVCGARHSLVMDSGEIRCTS